DAGAPQRLEHRRQVLDRHPVELHVLAHGEIGHAARVALGEIGERAELVRLQRAVGDADAHHEVGHRLALAALAADRAHAVALAVNAPPAEVHAPLRRDGGDALAGEPLDLSVGFPRIERLLETLGPLRFRFLRCLAHHALQKRKSPKADRSPPGFRLRYRLSPEPLYPTYFRGTSTHALHRGHLAVTRPLGPSTFRM